MGLANLMKYGSFAIKPPRHPVFMGSLSISWRFIKILGELGVLAVIKIAI